MKNISGTLAAATTSQRISDDIERIGFSIFNQSAGDLYFALQVAASTGAGSIKLQPGQLYESPVNSKPDGQIFVFGATLGQAFTAWEW